MAQLDNLILFIISWNWSVDAFKPLSFFDTNEILSFTWTDKTKVKSITTVILM